MTCRCGPASTWCYPPPSSGMVCCIRCGCGSSDMIRVSKCHTELARAAHPSRAGALRPRPFCAVRSTLHFARPWLEVRSTLRWREVDSNPRSLSRASRFILRKVNWGGSTGQPKNFAGYRWFESISLQRGVTCEPEFSQDPGHPSASRRLHRSARQCNPLQLRCDWQPRLHHLSCPARCRPWSRRAKYRPPSRGTAPRPRANQPGRHLRTEASVTLIDLSSDAAGALAAASDRRSASAACIGCGRS
jgi:hypothetical protein